MSSMFTHHQSSKESSRSSGHLSSSPLVIRAQSLWSPSVLLVVPFQVMSPFGHCIMCSTNSPQSSVNKIHQSSVPLLCYLHPVLTDHLLEFNIKTPWEKAWRFPVGHPSDVSKNSSGIVGCVICVRTFFSSSISYEIFSLIQEHVFEIEYSTGSQEYFLFRKPFHSVSSSSCPFSGFKSVPVVELLN